MSTTEPVSSRPPSALDATALDHALLPDNAVAATDGRLAVGGVNLLDLADRFGTPLFVYDEEHLRRRCREARAVFGDGGAIYASKAFLCRAMARLAHEEGLRIDVATGGELEVVLAAQVPADRLVMHGNNKSAAELARALEVGVAFVPGSAFRTRPPGSDTDADNTTARLAFASRPEEQLRAAARRLAEVWRP